MIRLSGGQQIRFYDPLLTEPPLPAVVRTALQDRWLSFIEMENLWNGLAKKGLADDGPYFVMQVLAQTDLWAKGSLVKLTPTQKATWDGAFGVGALRSGSLALEGGRGSRITLVQHFIDQAPAFSNTPFGPRPPVGSNLQLFNMNARLNEIQNALTIAPDDQIALARVQRLHYVMQVPPGNARLLGGVLANTVATDAQRKMYKKWIPANSPRYLWDLDQLALSMGL